MLYIIFLSPSHRHGLFQLICRSICLFSLLSSRLVCHPICYLFICTCLPHEAFLYTTRHRITFQLSSPSSSQHILVVSRPSHSTSKTLGHVQNTEPCSILYIDTSTLDLGLLRTFSSPIALPSLRRSSASRRRIKRYPTRRMLLPKPPLTILLCALRILQLPLDDARKHLAQPRPRFGIQ